MTADVFPGKAMLPGVKVYVGHQAGCNADECATDERGVWMGRWVRWWGDFRATWIEARLDALAHNLDAHPSPIPTWEEIIHGHHADELHAVRTH